MLAFALGMPVAGCAQGQGSSTDSVAASTQSSSSSDAAEPAAATEAPNPTAEIADVTSVAYLGPAGTYTEEATKLFFGTNDELKPQETVADALALVKDGTVAYAVIPQENAIGGPVTDYIDALLKTDGLSVVGEVVLPIHQTLMGLPGTDLSQVTRVLSHKQGLAQGSGWLDQHLPAAERVEAASTAAAAKEVAEGGDTTAVAIAAPGAAELYGLEVLEQNVAQSDTNKTRFYVVSQTPNQQEGYDRAVFVANREASKLPELLDGLCKDGTELVCVHDRPDGSTLGSYRYVIELAHTGGFADAELTRLKGIDGLVFLGAYRSIEG